MELQFQRLKYHSHPLANQLGVHGGVAPSLPVDALARRLHERSPERSSRDGQLLPHHPASRSGSAARTSQYVRGGRGPDRPPRASAHRLRRIAASTSCTGRLRRGLLSVVPQQLRWRVSFHHLAEVILIDVCGPNLEVLILILTKGIAIPSQLQ